MIVPDGSDIGPESEAGEAQLTIQQVSKILNLPAPTIRSWERRYGVPAADRSSGGHRRYTRDQLDRLRRMRDLIAQGRRPVEAAVLLKAGDGTSAGGLVHAFLQGAHDLAPESIARTLQIAHETLGLERTIDEVLLPAMREVGEWWHTGRIEVSHEHLATNAARAWLSTLIPAEPPLAQRPVILSCGPSDHHTLGLEAIGALLRHRLLDCRLLGARTPGQSLSQAVQQTDAAAVVLVCHVTAGRPAAIDALRSTQLDASRLFYAGGAFASYRARHAVPGQYLGTNLARAADLVAAAITSATSESLR